MIVVPQSFRQMPRWWRDDAGQAWLDTLPAVVRMQCQRWNLVIDGTPLHGSNAFVVPVQRSGEPLALRLAPPGDDVAGQAQALGHWSGRGVVTLRDVDTETNATLLERLDGRRTLMTEPLSDALRILGALVRELAVPAPDCVPDTRDIAASLASSFAGDWSAAHEPTLRAHLDRAIECATSLSEAPRQPFSVNGDLHFDQVLAGTRAPWLVVDPVLLRGDPEYDFARILWTRLDELERGTDVEVAFHTLVETAGAPPERARSWVVVRSMSYLLWGLERGLTIDPPKCRRLLDLFA